MADFTPEQGDLVKLKEPNWAETVGQGEPPAGMSVNVNGKEYFFRWGMTLQVSDGCDPEHKIAKLDPASGYPLVRDDFVREHLNQFTLKQKATTDEE